MCLQVKNPVLEVAISDITVYKFVEHSNNLNGLLTTPFQYMQVEIGKSYETELNISLGNSDFSFVDEGFHSFKYMKDAILFSKSGDGYFAAMCIIPKGATYYEGVSGIYDNEGYASDKIKYISIL